MGGEPGVMTANDALAVLPYSAVVEQTELKRALEVAFVARALGGVLVSGQRGTAKSTAVRAFARMVYGELPVTLPINATDDRVIGGWRIDALMNSEAAYQRGLLEEAAEKGMLYIDEVNLLDDHIVNLILDVTSTGVLSVQRDMLAEERLQLSFTLVGTMNPEEGGLRPQLLDRFGLMVAVHPENDRRLRRKILDAVLSFDQARAAARPTAWLRRALEADRVRGDELRDARKRLPKVRVPPAIKEDCAKLAEALQLAGHRGEYVTALAARALASLEGERAVRREHVMAVAPMALTHRTPVAVGGHAEWSADHEAALRSVMDGG